MVCTIDLFLRIVLFVVLCGFVVQFFSQRDNFQPWNKYGAVAIKHMPSRSSTNTTRLEYDYVQQKFPYKGRPIHEQSYLAPVAPITSRQIQEQVDTS